MEKMMENKNSMKVSGRQSPDCMASTSMTIETAEGTEQVNWNMGTGEITYGPNACEIEGQGKKDGQEDDESEKDYS